MCDRFIITGAPLGGLCRLNEDQGHGHWRSIRRFELLILKRISASPFLKEDVEACSALYWRMHRIVIHLNTFYQSQESLLPYSYQLIAYWNHFRHSLILLHFPLLS